MHHPHAAVAGTRNSALQQRRRFLRRAGSSVLVLACASGWLSPAHADAPGWNNGAFDATSIDDAIKALGLAGPPRLSTSVMLAAPDIAEDGAEVPLALQSTLAGVQRIAILVENNPNALAAHFDLAPGAEPAITLRVKLAQTTAVFGVVQAGDQLWFARRDVKVTNGGCGG